MRKEAQIALESADFDEPWVVVDVKSLTGGKDPARPAHHYQLCDPAQPVIFVPMTGPYYEWQFMETNGMSEAEATDPAYVRSKLRAFVPQGQVEIIRIAYYKFHALLGEDLAKRPDPAGWRLSPPDAAVPGTGHVLGRA